MSGAQRYGELADGLRESLRAQYGSDVEGAYAVGIAFGAAVSVTSAVIGSAIGVDTRTMGETIVQHLVAPPTADEVRTEHDTRREAERIGRLVIALNDRSFDASLSLRPASSGRVSVTVWHKAGPASIAAYGDILDGLAGLPDVLDTAIDRIDRGDWSK